MWKNNDRVWVALTAKTCSYLDYDGKEEKKAKGTKKCVVKRKIKFSDYKICLFNNNPVLRSQEVFKSEFHDVYTLRVNKIALSSNYKLMIKLQHIHMERVLGKLLKQSY